jgi:hypothetical protein
MNFSLFEKIENENKENNQASIFINLINETKLISFNKRFFSMIECFYETEQRFNYTIRNSKIILLRDSFTYFLNIISERVKIKLIKGSNIKVIDENKIYELNSDNNNIKINICSNVMKFIGYNSLINIFFPLTYSKEFILTQY